MEFPSVGASQPRRGRRLPSLLSGCVPLPEAPRPRGPMQSILVQALESHLPSANPPPSVSLCNSCLQTRSHQLEMETLTRYFLPGDSVRVQTYHITGHINI